MSGYQPKVYRRQGGKEMVVADGGKLIIEAGGEVDVEGDVFTATPPDDETIELNQEDKLALVAGGVTDDHVAADADIALTKIAFPTTDPAVAGQVWLNNEGALVVSAGE